MEKIMEAMKKAEKNFGSHEDIVLTREAYHACNPSAPQTWHCNAVRVDKNIGQDDLIGQVGHVVYNFEWMDKEIYDAVEDASDFPWEVASTDDFIVDQEFDLTDPDQRAEFLTYI